MCSAARLQTSSFCQMLMPNCHFHKALYCYFWKCVRMPLPYTASVTMCSNSLVPDQARRCVGPGLGPNSLQRLSAEDTRRQRAGYTAIALLPLLLLSHYQFHNLYYSQIHNYSTDIALLPISWTVPLLYNYCPTLSFYYCPNDKFKLCSTVKFTFVLS